MVRNSYFLIPSLISSLSHKTEKYDSCKLARIRDLTYLYLVDLKIKVDSPENNVGRFIKTEWHKEIWKNKY